MKQKQGGGEVISGADLYGFDLVPGVFPALTRFTIAGVYVYYYRSVRREPATLLFSISVEREGFCAVMSLKLPQVGEHLLLSSPAPHVLQMTLNRPKQLNAMTDAMEMDICKVFEWFETEPSLWVIILAGKGRAFCAGQDLKDWLEKNRTSQTVTHANGEPMQTDAEVNVNIERMKRGGFGGMSARKSVKPIIASVDGICMGGGTETILNCDMVVASTRSVIGLPEVARGVVAAMGGIPRLTQLCGHVSIVRPTSRKKTR